MHLFITFLYFFLIQFVFAETATITLKVTVPKNTQPAAPLTLGCSCNNWNPAAEGYQLTKQTDGTYQFTFAPQPVGTVLLFKITRGSWETVEIAKDGSNIEDRKLTVTPGYQTVEINVAGWADLNRPVPPSTITGNVLIEDVELPTFSSTRKLRIYLPPDYNTSQKRYPVIYMTDGQNLFDKATSPAGEWEMDELMQRLHSEDSPLTSIIVGIDHAGENRVKEYMPFPFGENRYNLKGDGKAALFAGFVVNTLKPMIDKRFRTKPDREYTTFMGSSMGGLITLYIGLTYQDTFSKIACLSSSFMQGMVGSNLLNYIDEVGSKRPMRIHLDIGDKEASSPVSTIYDDTEAVYDALQKAGFDSANVRLQIIKGGLHNEAAWRSRIEDILNWLNKNTY